MTAEPAWLAQAFRDPETAGRRPCPCSDHSEPTVRRDISPNLREQVIANMKVNGWTNERGTLDADEYSVEPSRILHRAPPDRLYSGTAGRLHSGVQTE